MKNDSILYKEKTGWNRSKAYIDKIRSIQDRMLRRALPYEDSYDYESDKENYWKSILEEARANARR